MRTLWWEDGKVILINQRKLPEKLEHVECLDLQQVAHAIKTLEIRGAPAIGVAAAMALALMAHYSKARSLEELLRELEQGAETIKQTRPTAWNLFWAADRVMSDVHAFKGSLKQLKEAVVAHAQAIAEEDIATNKQLGTHGADLINDRDVVGTICNAGWLATAGEYGTALGVVKVAHEQGKNIQVIALETRPVLQGARLTTWELKQDGIPVRVIADSALGYCLSRGMVSKMVVGADRIAVEDGCYVFNKIGTYMAAIVARRHNVPFYVAAPLSTFDFAHRLNEVIVEERSPSEVTSLAGKQLVPEGVEAFNPAFDITPPSLVDAFITERGVFYQPFRQNALRLTECS